MRCCACAHENGSKGQPALHGPAHCARWKRQVPGLGRGQRGVSACALALPTSTCRKDQPEATETKETAEGMGQRAETCEEAAFLWGDRARVDRRSLATVRATALYVGGPAPRNPNPRPVVRNTGSKSRLRALAQNCLRRHSPQEPPRTQQTKGSCPAGALGKDCRENEGNWNKPRNQGTTVREAAHPAEDDRTNWGRVPSDCPQGR